MPAKQNTTTTSAPVRRRGTVSEMDGLDSADPHPAEEGDPYDTRTPSRPNPPNVAKNIGPNPAKHDGNAPHRPDTAAGKVKA